MSGLQDEKTPPGPVSRQAAYNKASSYVLEAIEVNVEIMRNSKNDSNRIAAANKIIDKVLPNLKATELSGKDGTAPKFTVIIQSGTE